MIPATSFGGKHVAVFGLGGSGRATAAALVAGGAIVSAWDDNAEAVAAADAAGIPVADPHDTDWTGFAALVLAPGVPLTHPAPHWTVVKAEAGRHRDHRRHRDLLPRAPAQRADGAVRGGDRHQRQIDDHRADRPPPEDRRARHPDRRQYRHADPVARSAAGRPLSRHRGIRRSRSTWRRASTRRSASSST